MNPKMNNRIAKLIRTIAWITYIIVFFMGVSAGNAAGYISYGNVYPFSWIAAFSTWLAGFVSGTLLLGFAEIIELLQKLVDQDVKAEVSVTSPFTTENTDK